MASDTGDPYKLPFPDGDDVPDGPAQMEALARQTAAVIRNVETSAANNLNAYKEHVNKINADQNTILWNLGVSGGAALPRSEFDQYKAFAASVAPIYLTVDILSPVVGSRTNINAGQEWRMQVRNISGMLWVPQPVFSIIDPYNVQNTLYTKTIALEIRNLMPGGFDIKCEALQSVDITFGHSKLFTVAVLCTHPLAVKTAKVTIQD